MYWWANVCEIAPLPRKSAKSRPYQNFRTSATFSSSKYIVNLYKIAVISLLYSVYYELYFSVLIVLINPFFVKFRIKIILGGLSGRSFSESRNLQAAFLNPRIIIIIPVWEITVQINRVIIHSHFQIS